MAAADAVWVLGRKGLDWRQERDSFVQQVRASYAPRVLAIESRYEVRTKEGQHRILSWQGLGFIENNGYALVPAEAVEPWLFEGAMADAIAAKEVELVKG